MYGRPLRLEEARSLTWGDYDQKELRLIVWRPKTEVETVLPVSSRLIEQLSWWNNPFNPRNDCEELIPGNRDAAVALIRRTMAKINKRDGGRKARRYGKATLSTLRDTFATRMLQHGLPLADVAYLLGHTNIRQTMKYAHVTRGSSVERAAEILG
jgi:integrase